MLPRDGYRIEKIVLTPEAGISLPALALIPAALWLHSSTAQVVFAVVLAVIVLARHRRNLAAAFSRSPR